MIVFLEGEYSPKEITVPSLVTDIHPISTATRICYVRADTTCSAPGIVQRASSVSASCIFWRLCMAANKGLEKKRLALILNGPCWQRESPEECATMAACAKLTTPGRIQGWNNGRPCCSPTGFLGPIFDLGTAQLCACRW